MSKSVRKNMLNKSKIQKNKVSGDKSNVKDEEVSKENDSDSAIVTEPENEVEKDVCNVNENLDSPEDLIGESEVTEKEKEDEDIYNKLAEMLKSENKAEVLWVNRLKLTIEEKKKFFKLKVKNGEAFDLLNLEYINDNEFKLIPNLTKEYIKRFKSENREFFLNNHGLNVKMKVFYSYEVESLTFKKNGLRLELVEKMSVSYKVKKVENKNEED